MSSIHDRMPWPHTRDVDPTTRRARLLAARQYKTGVVRRAILMGHWDGGEVLAKYGLPRVGEDWPSGGCEALKEEE